MKRPPVPDRRRHGVYTTRTTAMTWFTGIMLLMPTTDAVGQP